MRRTSTRELALTHTKAANTTVRKLPIASHTFYVDCVSGGLEECGTHNVGAAAAEVSRSGGAGARCVAKETKCSLFANLVRIVDGRYKYKYEDVPANHFPAEAGQFAGARAPGPRGCSQIGHVITVCCSD